MSSVEEDSDPSNSNSDLNFEVEDTALAQLDKLLEWMETKMKSSTNDILDDLKIIERQPFLLKQDWKSRVDISKQVGANTFMSSENTYKFLDMLLHLVARPVCSQTRGRHGFHLTIH
ncbi:hypothetical protein DXG01_010622 [Tephrocybe rancida]|nr:hypothetical protein DXG01_010622 [Tephrocybe rancida]